MPRRPTELKGLMIHYLHEMHWDVNTVYSMNYCYRVSKIDFLKFYC